MLASLCKRRDALDPDDGYRLHEALCLVCNLTFNRHLPSCPNSEDHR